MNSYAMLSPGCMGTNVTEGNTGVVFNQKTKKRNNPDTEIAVKD
jgi:hypothetical protein